MAVRTDQIGLAVRFPERRVCLRAQFRERLQRQICRSDGLPVFGPDILGAVVVGFGDILPGEYFVIKPVGLVVLGLVEVVGIVGHELSHERVGMLRIARGQQEIDFLDRIDGSPVVRVLVQELIAGNQSEGNR